MCPYDDESSPLVIALILLLLISEGKIVAERILNQNLLENSSTQFDGECCRKLPKKLNGEPIGKQKII